MLAWLYRHVTRAPTEDRFLAYADAILPELGLMGNIGLNIQRALNLPYIPNSWVNCGTMYAGAGWGHISLGNSTVCSWRIHRLFFTREAAVKALAESLCKMDEEAALKCPERHKMSRLRVNIDTRGGPTR